MEHLVRGVVDALERECWYAAVALALAIPDACASVDDLSMGTRRRVGERYRSWAQRYVEPRFCNPDGRPYLTARELYAIRCAFLHGGDFVTDDPEPTEVDDSAAMFEFLNQLSLYVCEMPVVAARQLSTGADSRRTSYNVSVTDFCRAICDGALEWLASEREDPTKRDRMRRFLRVTRISLDGSQDPV